MAGFYCCDEMCTDCSRLNPAMFQERERLLFARSLTASDCLQTEDEMAEMERDIHGLDADLQVKTASLKLAHTRLENRTNRPGMDLCRDEV